MTIRYLFATITMCGTLALAGCTAKEAVKIDTAATSADLTSTSAATTQSGTEKADSSKKTDSAMEENISKDGEVAKQIYDAITEIRLETLYFDFDSYLLSQEARDTLSRNARWLDENRRTNVVIEGHADERGSDEYNLALAEKRALAARSYIETLGIDISRMETISYGEEKPAVIGHDEAGWAENRRVEFVIVR